MSLRFLVVDDDYLSRSVIQKNLAPYGSVNIAEDGEICVAAFLKALKENRPYTLITLDILMPNADGQQALREIREIEKEFGIPPEKATKVLLLSGLDDSHEVHDAFFLGSATSFLIKPISRKKLLAEITQLGIILEERTLS